MRKQTKLLSAMAGALLAMGLSVSANAGEGFVTAEYHADNALTQVFDDGSTLQVFEDGSRLVYDPATGYASATVPAPENTMVASSVGVDAGSSALTHVFDDGSVLEAFDDGSLLAVSPDSTYMSVVPAGSVDSLTKVYVG